MKATPGARLFPVISLQSLASEVISLSSSLTGRSKSTSAAAVDGFNWLRHAQAETFMATLLWSAHVYAARRELVLDLTASTVSFHQVPEWTKCSSREKRKEKKVEKPFYSDSEGESGPTESADSGNLGPWQQHDFFYFNWSPKDVVVWECGWWNIDTKIIQHKYCFSLVFCWDKG